MGSLILDPRTSWPHAPLHLLSSAGTYFVTCGTYQKLHHFRGPARLGVLHRGLLKLAQEYGWQLEAWAVFSNHYHFVGHSPRQEDTAESLGLMLKELHARTAIWVNKLDQAAGRQVWFNYRETRLTYLGSYLARLNYVHQNPVRHGLVANAALYPWCSAAWFEATASYVQVAKIYGMRLEMVRVYDEFEPAAEW